MSSQIANPSYILQRLADTSLLIYPIVAHAGILMHQVMIPVIYLMVAIYINSLKQFLQHQIISAVYTALFCVVIYAIIKSELHTFIIYLPPILIPCWLAIVFLGSLRTERAFISRIAELMEGQALDRRHLLYTKRLTALWGVVFILMSCEAIVLAIWAPFEVWSWWVHVGNYIIVATLFLIEITVRHKFIGKRARFIQMFRALLQQKRRD